MRRPRSSATPTYPILAIAFLTMVAGSTSGCSLDGSSEVLERGWEYRWGDSPTGPDGTLAWLDPGHEPDAWKPFRPPRRPGEPRSSRDVLWMRVLLPSDLPPQSAAAFVFVDQAFEAYVGNHRVHQHGQIGQSTQALGRPAQLFRLGASPAGQLLTLRVYSTAKSIGIAGNPRVGSPTRLVGAHLRAHPALAISTFLCLGLALVIFLLFAFIPSDRELPLIGSLAFLAGFYTVVSGFSPIKPLLGLEPSPQLSLGTLFIIPSVYCALCATLLKRRLFKWLATGMFLFVVASVLGSWAGLFSMFQALGLFRVYAPASMVLGVVLSAVDLRRGKQHALLCLVAFLSIFLASVHDALLDARVVPGETMWLSWGLVIAFTGHGVSALRRYAEGMLRSRRLERELSAKSVQLEQARAQVVAAVAEMRDKTGDIAASVGAQLDNSREQAQTLDRSRTQALAIAETSRLAAEQAKAVASTVQRSEELSAEGQRSVEHTTQVMLQLADQVHRIAGAIEQLSADTSRIAEVVGAAQEVAEQSKMLALNASLEAARAGESGRGFAVVAREVQALANRSSEATLQVKKLLSDVGGRTEAAAAAARSGLNLAAEVSELARRSGASIEGLGSVVREASEVARGIEIQSLEQARGVGGVVTALDEARVSVDQLLHSAGEVRETASYLARLTEELSRTVHVDAGAPLEGAGARVTGGSGTAAEPPRG